MSAGAESRFYPPRAKDDPWWGRALASLGRAAVFPWELLGSAFERAWELHDARARSRRRTAEDAPADAALVLDPWLAMALSGAPGLGHWFVRRPGPRPWALAAGYAALAFVTLLFPPAGLQQACFLALFGFHQWVLLDSHGRCLDSLSLPRPRGLALFYRGAAAATLLSLLYAAAGVLLRGLGGPVLVDRDELAPVVRRGDRLWIVPRRSYERGALVYSRVRGGLERVVALPGEEVSVEAGRIFVDGRALPEAQYPISRRLLQSSRLDGALLVVPAGAYLVLFPARHAYLYKNELLGRFIIGQRELAGEATRRYWPRPERL